MIDLFRDGDRNPILFNRFFLGKVSINNRSLPKYNE